MYSKIADPGRKSTAIVVVIVIVVVTVVVIVVAVCCCGRSGRSQAGLLIVSCVPQPSRARNLVLPFVTTLLLLSRHCYWGSVRAGMWHGTYVHYKGCQSRELVGVIRTDK
jgi:hypothetical protein